MAHRVIGTSPARADAWEKVRGRPIYAGDLALSGMLHGRVVRSPYPSARIVRLDTRAAAALSGVVAVLTARDVPRNELRMELPGRMAEATAGAVLATQPVLADARVRFQGEPVAAGSTPSACWCSACAPRCSSTTATSPRSSGSRTVGCGWRARTSAAASGARKT